MNSFQHLTLTLLSILIAVLVFFNLGMAISNQNKARKAEEANIMLMRSQNVIRQARQAEGVLKQLSMRIAIASDTEPGLKDLLKKYELNVTLNIDGKTKEYP